MEFTITESQAERAVEYALHIFEDFIKDNEENKLKKIIVSGKTFFEDGYRKNISMLEEEFVYQLINDSVHVFNNNRFGQFTIHELSIFISHLDEELSYYYFQ